MLARILDSGLFPQVLFNDYSIRIGILNNADPGFSLIQHNLVTVFVIIFRRSIPALPSPGTFFICAVCKIISIPA